MKKQKSDQIKDETHGQFVGEQSNEDTTNSMKTRRSLCQRCNKKFPSYLLDEHHYPIQKKDGGTETQMWCKKCHDAYHGITPQMNIMKQKVMFFYGIQAFRKSLANKINSAKRLELDEIVIQDLKDQLQIFTELEKVETKKLEKMVKVHPLWNGFLKDVTDIGYIYAANLIGIIGNINRFDSVSSLWSYSGLGVVNGKAPRPTKGQHLGYNPMLKTLCLGKIADNFVKVSGKADAKYGQLYKKIKLDEQTKHPEPIENPNKKPKMIYTKGHIEKRTRRRVVKEFMKDLYLNWKSLDE